MALQYQPGLLPWAIEEVFGQRHSAGRLARILVHELELRYRVAPPMCPCGLASTMGVTVEYGSLPTEGALMDWPGPNPRIIVRPLGPSAPEFLHRRQRFTIAHELGHILLRDALSVTLKHSDYSLHDPEEERICNAFAAELLMPSHAVSRDFKSLGVSPRALLAISDIYGTSLTSTGIRACELARRNHVVMLMWTESGGSLTPCWSSDKRYRAAILVDTGRTTVERSAETPIEHHGRDQLLVNGERQAWQAASLRIGKSDKILAVLVRAACRFPLLRSPSSDPKQLSLFPIENTRAGTPRTSKPTLRDMRFLVRGSDSTTNGQSGPGDLLGQ